MTGHRMVSFGGRRLLVVAVVAAASGSGSGSGGSCGGAAGPGITSVGPALTAKSGLAVTFSTQTFVDTSRPTSVTFEEPERPSRRLVTTIARPAGPVPFILFSHGCRSVSTVRPVLLPGSRSPAQPLRRRDAKETA